MSLGRNQKDGYLEQDGVRFLMADEDGSEVACRISHDAPRDHADRLHLSGGDGVIFDRTLRRDWLLGIFPVIQFLFPDSPKIFPVLTLREIR